MTDLNSTGRISNNLAFDTNIKTNSTSVSKSGSLHGQSIAISQPDNSSFDEERGQFVRDFKKIDIKKRGMKSSDKNSRILERIKKIQSIQSLQDYKNKLADFKNQERLTQSEILKQSKEFSDDDPVVADALIDFAIDDGDFDPEVVDQFRIAKKSLNRDNGKLIDVGNNLSEDISDLLKESDLKSDIRSEREGYVESVKDYKSMSKYYQFLCDLHGGEKFYSSLDLQMKLLSKDLSLTTDSTSKSRLNVILNDMKCLKILSSTHESFVTLKERMIRMFAGER